mmetsp:Transcript_62173/g.98347  ORF Transcript_62173/g.98347 Transcript_62173/m.98347 type:complete len:185 (-) Transcript_62173:123-677(-)
MKAKKLRKSLVVSLISDEHKTQEALIPMPLLLAKQELELLWRTTPLNRYFLPISQIPRPTVNSPEWHLKGNEPPSCCPKAGTPKAGRLMRRWASLPSTAPPIDDIRNDGDDAEDLFGSESPEFCRLQERRRQRQSFKGAYLRALQRSPKLTAEGKEYPFIPCTCCERKSPIPRLTRYAPREAWQ